MTVESLGPVGSLAGTPLAASRLADAIGSHAAESSSRAGARSRSADDTTGVQQTEGGDEVGHGEANPSVFWDYQEPHRQGGRLQAEGRENAVEDVGRHIDLSG